MTTAQLDLVVVLAYLGGRFDAWFIAKFYPPRHSESPSFPESKLLTHEPK